MPTDTMTLREALRQALTTLDLEPGCDPGEVKRAYLELVQVWHPDRFGDKPQLQQRATEKLQQINDAYHLLREHYAANRHLTQDYTQPYRSASPSPPAADPSPPSSWENPWENPWNRSRYAESASSPWQRSRTYQRWSRTMGGLVLGFYVFLWFLPSLNPVVMLASLFMGLGSVLLWPYRRALVQQWQVLQQQIQQQLQHQAPRSSGPDRSAQANPQPKQEQYRQLQARLVALAGGDAVARVLFKSLVDRYPGKSAEWYYQQAIEILEYQHMHQSPPP